MKNVLAIAAGIVEGRGLGASAHAALVTRGFAELRRFGEALGAEAETLMGLSGLGDLRAHLRQPAVAQHVARPGAGQGQDAGGRAGQPTLRWRKASIPRRRRAVCAREAASTCRSARPCTPSSQGRQTVDDAIAALLQRPLKAED